MRIAVLDIPTPSNANSLQGAPAMLFINNKYTNWYNAIILKAQQRDTQLGYTEKHHIIPRSLGGNDEDSNIVRLTAKEHFICHLLLINMTDGFNKRSMAYAAWQMTFIKGRPRYKVNSRIYELLKRKLSETYKNIDRKGEKNPFYGRKHSSKTLNIQRTIKLGSKNPNFGIEQKPEWNKKKSDAQKGKPKPPIQCEHCQKIVGGHGNYFRWHGANCKLNKTKENNHYS